MERVKIKTDLLMSAAPKLLLVRSKSATTGTSKAMHVQTITTIKSSLATFSTFSSKRSAMNSTTSSMSNVQIPAGGYQAVPYHFIHDLATKAARSGRPTMHPHCGLGLSILTDFGKIERTYRLPFQDCIEIPCGKGIVPQTKIFTCVTFLFLL